LLNYAPKFSPFLQVTPKLSNLVLIRPKFLTFTNLCPKVLTFSPSYTKVIKFCLNYAIVTQFSPLMLIPLFLPNFYQFFSPLPHSYPQVINFLALLCPNFPLFPNLCWIFLLLPPLCQTYHVFHTFCPRYRLLPQLCPHYQIPFGHTKVMYFSQTYPTIFPLLFIPSKLSCFFLVMPMLSNFLWFMLCLWNLPQVTPHGPLPSSPPSSWHTKCFVLPI